MKQKTTARVGRDRDPKSGKSEGRTVKLGALTEGIGYVLRRAQLASFKSFQQVFGAAQISPAQYSALLVIKLNPGLRQNQVSDALGIKRANFVGLIDELEQRGLVKRLPALDRRSYALELTSQGRKFLKSLHALNSEHERRLSGALDEAQRTTLMIALEAIVRSLDEAVAQSELSGDSA